MYNPKIKQKKMKVKRFQVGGSVEQGAPAQEAPAGAQEGQGSPEEQIMGMAQQIIQSIGPEAAAMLAQVIMQMLQEAQGQGAPQQAPAYQRKGGKLVRI